MMKMQSVFFLLLFAQLSHTTSVDEIAEKAWHYNSFGHAGNQVAFREVYNGDEYRRLEIPGINLAKQKQTLVSAIADCVFLATSARGEHFNFVTHQLFAKRLADFIFSQPSFRKHRFYKVTFPPLLIADGAFNAPCALAIEQPDRVSLLQGFSK